MRRSPIRKSNRNIVLTFLFFVFLLVPASYAQNKKELENKKKKLQEEINYTNKLLSETKKNKKLSLNQLVTLNKKISARQELIATINKELSLLETQILENHISINKLKKDLEKLKMEYAKMIYYAYRNRDAYSKLMFIFAAKDFTQAYMRLKYFQQYGQFRQKQAKEIEMKQQMLNGKVSELEVKKGDKKVLLTNEETEKQHLSKEKTQKEVAFNELQNKEKQLKKELEKKKKDAEKLQAAIQKLIEEEIRKARKKAKDESKPEPKSIVLTPEAQLLSNSFAGNKGKLPWPVLKGIITGRFGIHPHPLMPEVDVSNDGIDITTSKGTLARSVFEGEVTGIASLPGSGKVVIIRHGEYLSVYANMNDVYVKTGEKVKTKQNIGTILYDESDGKTELQLQIWKGQTKLDPEAWLFKNN